MGNSKYYRIELDDYSAASFTSMTKTYFAALDDVQKWLDEIAADECYRNSQAQILTAFQAFKDGARDLTLNVAYTKAPFLVPAKVLHSEKFCKDAYVWEHLNTWHWPYNMRCERVESEHIWLSCRGHYSRHVKARFINLQYEGTTGEWHTVGDMIWGYPKVIAIDGTQQWNRIAEPEKFFKSKSEVEADWEAFITQPDPIYKGFCEDIFGDG